MTNPFDTLFQPVDRQVVAVPVLVKGELRLPPALSRQQLEFAAAAAARPPAADALHSFEYNGVQVIQQPVYERESFAPTDEQQFLLFARPEPRELLETDPVALARDLHSLPFSEVMAYVDALREVLSGQRGLLARAAAQASATSLLDDRLLQLVFEQLATLLDPEALGAAVDRELAGADGPGRRYLDGWVEVGAPPHRGMTARLADGVFRRGQSVVYTPRLRAVPTRQLHISAGNSPLLPLLSLLRGLATKGALVVKSPAEVTAVTALLAVAMHAAAPEHPLTRHTSLVYWPGGERSVEDVLFADGAFDRLVVWGSPATVRSVRARAPQAKTVFLNPRYGLSLIGRQAWRDNLDAVAVRASVDSMIANQQACTAALVHYVEGDEQQALDYCRALQRALARWDERLPHRLPRATLGRLRMLRRTALLAGHWFVNGREPDISSAVVYMPAPFDLSVHPLCRLVVVRRLDSLEQIAPLLNSSVSTLGVYPQQAALAVRDIAAAAGVSNILPLGECEQVYAGMPHDGMRMLSELVNWTTA